jgi:molybdopterin converting factor small subunit
VSSRIPPVSEADAVRARVPAVLRVYAETRETVLEGGQVDRSLKELCARYIEEDEEVVGYSGAASFDERERAALDWAHAIAWDSDKADEDLWARLHANFSEPELVELGYFIAFTLGQSHWLRSLGLGAGPGA